MKALWHSLAAEIERRGAAAVLADIERIAERLDADIEAAFNLATPVITFDPQFGGASSVSLIVCISKELHDAADKHAPRRNYCSHTEGNAVEGGNMQEQVLNTFWHDPERPCDAHYFDLNRVPGYARIEAVCHHHHEVNHGRKF